MLDNLLPLLWETQPERFPLAGTILDRAQGLIVHSAYVEQNARAAGYDGRLWRVPHPAWPMAHVEAEAGVSGDLPLAAMYQGARTLRIADGPDEVHRILIAKNVLSQYHRGTGWDFGS